MKLVWSPDSASKAYLDTVKSCGIFKDSGVAEFLSATAAGWNTKLIIEARSHGGSITSSIGLSIAARHTCGRHVCIVPDERTRSTYLKSMHESGFDGSSTTETIVGDAEEVMAGFPGVDFLLVDSKRKDFVRVLRLARFSNKGAVLVCKNVNNGATSSDRFRWHGVLERGTRVVRSVFLPVGQGLDVAHVGSGLMGESSWKSSGRWIRHVDRRSGEEHVFRG